ncbi:glycosyltransferase family 2 protein [Bacillaceae bacterium IKA-2]|nr:glycosyltransferase family 2 protein [Bacillaceae bacterium IKA-2]
MTNLSIIIPHYNSSDSLELLISSIPNIAGIEIIVVDDQSDLKHKDKLDEIRGINIQKNIFFHKNKSNTRSAGTCRNIGLRQAKGKWILFADADDFFVSNFYEIIRQYFQLTKDVIFLSPTSIESQTGNMSDRHKNYEKIINNYLQKADRKSELYLRFSFFVPWSKLLRRDFLMENNIFFDEVIASNDVMFSTKVGYYMKYFEVSNKVIYCVTRNNTSLTVNISEQVFDARVMVHINYCIFLTGNLNIEDLKFFDLRGSGYLLNVIKYRLGLKKLVSTYFLLRKSKIKVFDLKYFNPLYTIKRITSQFILYKKNKKYFLK